MQHVTLMSYNIKVGTWTERGLEAVAEVIATADPDIVALQEVDRHMPRTGDIDQAAWLGERLGYQAVFGPATGGETFGTPGGQYGIAVLSRRPIVEHERRLLYHRPLPAERRPPRYSTEQRAILGCAIDLDGTAIDVFCTHLDLTPDQRVPQAREVADFCTSWHPGRPAVLMGDFNAFPDSPEIATVRTVLVDAFEERGITGTSAGSELNGHADRSNAHQAHGFFGDERLTFPSGPFGTRASNGWAGAIDYVFLSSHWRCTAIEVIRETTPASDHAPVVAQVELLSD